MTTKPPRDESYSDKETTASAQLPTSQGDKLRQSLPECDRHDETLLDEAIRETFPASDPVAAPKEFVDERDEAADAAEDILLDAAIEMTFPASDPISVQSGVELVREHKSIRVEPYRPSI